MSKEHIFMREDLLPGILCGTKITEEIQYYLRPHPTKPAKDFYGTDGTLAGTIIKHNNKIYIHYYGTKNSREILSDLNITSASIKYSDQDVYVHAGFYNVYQTSKNNMLQATKELDQADPPLSVVFSGHSMGAAITQIAALEYKNNYPDHDIKVVTLGGPRVFFTNSSRIYNDALGMNTLALQQIGDPIVHLPPPPLFCHAGYHRIRKEAMINTTITTTHQPNAYSEIYDYIDPIDISDAQNLAEKLRDRLNLIREKENLQKQINNERKTRFKNAYNALINNGLIEALSVLRNTSDRNRIISAKKQAEQNIKNFPSL